MIWKYLILILIGGIAINQIMNPTFTEKVYGESMYPIINNLDDVTFSYVEEPIELKQGDIVIYDAEDKNVKRLHRIVYIGEDKDGWYAILKGDNNRLPDGTVGWIEEEEGIYFIFFKVRFEQILGKVIN